MGFAWLKRLFQWLLSFFTRKRQPADPMTPSFFPGARGPLQPPRDPSSGVRHPRSHRPGGKSAAIAVDEPDDDEALMAIGGPREQHASK